METSMSQDFNEHTEGSTRPVNQASANPAPSARPDTAASLDELTGKLKEDFADTTQVLKSGANAAVEKVRDVGMSQAGLAARQVEGVAVALEKVGAELEGSEHAPIGRYAKQMGRSVQNLARQIKGKDLGEIATMAEDFGRKQPLAFLGVAALAGLTASRFLTASAKRSNSEVRTSGSSSLSSKSKEPHHE
jgi:hypothetical protein